MKKHSEVWFVLTLLVILTLGAACLPQQEPAWETGTHSPPGEVGAQQRERIAIMAREDCILRYAADLYFYSDDRSTQVAHIDGATGNFDIEGTLDVAGNISDGDGPFTIADNVTITGQADVIQLLVAGYTTQTSSIFVVENSSGSDLFWVTNNGDVELNGTTPYITLGDAGEEDTGLVFDGNAQDFNISLDDTADDLVIGLGSAAGTTDILVLDENQDVGIGGASAGAKLDVTGNVLIDGAADEEQLVVQGNGTQTNSTFVVENSAGTDVLTVGNTGATWLNGGLDINGTGLTLDADADTTLTSSTDDILTVTLGAATGVMVIGSGNLKVGDVNADQTINGDDLVVGGLAEIDGILYADGGSLYGAGLDLNGNTLTYDADADTTLTTSTDDILTYTLGAATGVMVIGQGNLKVGDVNADQTINGDDAVIGGLLEVDGVIYGDGGMECNGTLTLENDETIVNSTDGTITATVAASNYFAISTGNLYVGEGTETPSLTLNGNDAYFAGTLEADGNARFDGDVTMGSGDLTIANGLFLWDFADLAVSDGETITPTVNAYALDTTGNVTITLAASASEGQLLVLIGDDANNIIIADTNIRTSTGGALTIGQYDIAVFIYQDSEWLELLLIANS